MILHERWGIVFCLHALLWRLPCIPLQRARATTKKIESPADLEGFPDLNDPEKDEIRQLIKEFVTVKSPAKTSAKKKATAGGGSGAQTTLPGASPTKPSTSGELPALREKALC